MKTCISILFYCEKKEIGGHVGNGGYSTGASSVSYRRSFLVVHASAIYRKLLSGMKIEMLTLIHF